MSGHDLGKWGELLFRLAILPISLVRAILVLFWLIGLGCRRVGGWLNCVIAHKEYWQRSKAVWYMGGEVGCHQSIWSSEYTCSRCGRKHEGADSVSDLENWLNQPSVVSTFDGDII